MRRTLETRVRLPVGAYVGRRTDAHLIFKMAKISFRKALGILPGALIFIIALILWFLVDFQNKLILLPTLIMALLLFLYYLTFQFAEELFDFGQLKLRDDEKILELERNHIIYNLAWLNGVGIAFLIPGLDVISTSPIMALSGFILIILGNVVYNMEYLPRYFLLKIKAEVDYEKNRKREYGKK